MEETSGLRLVANEPTDAGGVRKSVNVEHGRGLPHLISMLPKVHLFKRIRIRVRYSFFELFTVAYFDFGHFHAPSLYAFVLCKKKRASQNKLSHAGSPDCYSVKPQIC